MTSGPLFQERYPIEKRFSPDAGIIVHHGDVRDLLQTIPDETVKLVVTSPPYNIGKEYEEQVEIDEYLAEQAQTIAELHRVLHSQGSLCWQTGNYVDDGEIWPLDTLFYPIFKQLKMRLRNRIIWHFGHGLHCKNRFSGRYETILWFTKGDDYTFNLDPVRVPAKYPGKRHYKGPNRGKLSGNPKGKNPSDVWEIVAKDWEEAFWEIPNVKSNHPEKTVHPAQYPIELVERCVLALTDQNDWVLDPYAGVGSALIAAIKNGRRAMGAEKEEQYVEIAQERINSYYAGTLKIRPLGKPVYKPTGQDKVSQYPKQWSQQTLDIAEDNAE